jgi:hypothetical protein
MSEATLNVIGCILGEVLVVFIMGLGLGWFKKDKEK